jgi:hypothetical protein
MANGVTKMQTEARIIPVMKKPNIILEAIFTSERVVTTELGSVMVAPASSSLRIMATGLNQYIFSGGEQ